MAITVQDLCDAYQAWADTYYRHPDGRPTKNANNVADAIRELQNVYPDAAVSAFGLAELNKVQQAMVDSGRLCRSSVNSRIKIIQAMFKWAANRGLVDDLTPHRLAPIQALKRGRTKAREPLRVQGVSWDLVSATLPHLSLKWATMVELQWWTAMRPGEVCAMRTTEIHPSSDEVWHYCPALHKTAHHGITRRISLGPIAINLIRAWLRHVQHDLLFEGGGKCTRGKPSGKPVAVNSYRYAISKVCKARKLEQWSPAQIRHSALTRTYQEYDIAHAMEQAGHTTERTTRAYIDQPVVTHTLADIVAKNRG